MRPVEPHFKIASYNTSEHHFKNCLSTGGELAHLSVAFDQ